MKILDELGMNPANKGYTYWEEAINFKNDNYFDIKIIDIYEKIAKKYNTTSIKVEKNMRYSRQKIKNINEKMEVNFDIDNRTFLALLIKKIGEKNVEKTLFNNRL